MLNKYSGKWIENPISLYEEKINLYIWIFDVLWEITLLVVLGSMWWKN